MRCYFNMAGAVHDPDDEGHELPSVSDARIEAVRLASEYLHDRPEVVWLGDEFRVEVTTGTGLLLFTVIVFGVDAPAGSGR